MKGKKSSFYDKINDSIYFNRLNTSYFFFGIGITMFLLNLLGIMQIINYLNIYGNLIYFPMIEYYVSMISSIFLIIYSYYNVLESSKLNNK